MSSSNCWPPEASNLQLQAADGHSPPKVAAAWDTEESRAYSCSPAAPCACSTLHYKEKCHAIDDLDELKAKRPVDNSAINLVLMIAAYKLSDKPHLQIHLPCNLIWLDLLDLSWLACQ